jgi:SOS response associated peptidase (SRAP)
VDDAASGVPQDVEPAVRIVKVERDSAGRLRSCAADLGQLELDPRMPVMLLPDDYARWLDWDLGIEEARGLLRPFPAELMQAYPVSKLVNGSKNDTEECISPIEIA